MSTNTRTAALSAYRYILRATRVAFSEDIRALNGSRDQIRAGFRTDSTITDPKEIQERITYARDIGSILRQNVVQGKKESDDRLGKFSIEG